MTNPSKILRNFAKKFFEILFLSIIFIVPAAFAGTPESSDDNAPESEPQYVVAGIYVNRIDSFDIKTGMAVLDFWYWCRQTGTRESMLDGLELANGTLEPLLPKPIIEEKDGVYYETMRYRGTVQCQIGLKRFPFDWQFIELYFEDSNRTSDILAFRPDLKNSRLDPDCRLNGWVIKDAIFSETSHFYPTSYGSPITSDDGSDYSRFKTSIIITRSGSLLQKVLKYFWFVFIATAVGLFALLIPLRDQDSRFSMAVGSLFANVGCAYIIMDKLPESPDLTCAEIISHLSLGIIAFVLVESIVSLTFFNRGHEKISLWMDRIFMVLASFIYVYSVSATVFAI